MPEETKEQLEAKLLTLESVKIREEMAADRAADRAAALAAFSRKLFDIRFTAERDTVRAIKQALAEAEDSFDEGRPAADVFMVCTAHGLDRTAIDSALKDYGTVDHREM